MDNVCGGVGWVGQLWTEKGKQFEEQEGKIQGVCDVGLVSGGVVSGGQRRVV
jgi:hypothetical protein